MKNILIRNYIIFMIKKVLIYENSCVGALREKHEK